MSIKPFKPILAFLWQSAEISRSVVDAARRTSSVALFDVVADAPTDTAKVLRDARAKDVKLSVKDLMNPAFEGFLESSSVETLWVEYHPALVSCTPEAFLDRMGKLSTRYKCIPVSGDLDFLGLALQSEWQPPVIALKGSEAAGFTSRETVGILFSTMREMACRRSVEPEFVIWGGVATPEAAAAFLCTGAKGVVFESLHWRTDLVPTSRNLRGHLSRMRPEHTAVVGHNLGLSCRFYDKGNSAAVKQLKQFEDSLSTGAVTDDDRGAFARRVEETVTPALESELGNRELVFLGPEAAFAEAFAERFGRSTPQAIEAFSEEVVRLCREAPAKRDGFAENPAAWSLGIRYPFIQGAMTWISDVPEFALSVSEAGALPTVALGMKNYLDLEENLGRLQVAMGERPYAVNIIALPENACLQEQLTWIEKNRPPFVVIAAGDPSRAGQLRQKGIQPIYIASSEGLLRMALDAGVRFVVLEGNESGGHVGEHSTLTLAQIALELKRREPELFQDRYLVLAGGIYNRESAFRAFMLGADAVQMGTAYLVTREIVATGALSPLYQRLIVDSRPGMTTVSGESIGLRVRSLRTPKMEAICALEREWVSGRQDEDSFRRSLESLSANSLLMAARGIEHIGRRALDEETCLREGQFMSGAISGALHRVLTIAELHRDLAEGTLELSLPEEGGHPAPPNVHRCEQDGERIAITAMALTNSLGNNPGEIWDACLALNSGITAVPSSRWNHDLYYDPDPRVRGKTYCNVGAFQSIRISRKELGVAPQDFRSMADATKLTLWLAEQVIRQSGLLESGIPRERIGVLISQNSGECASTVKDIILDVNFHEIIHSLRELIPMTEEMNIAIQSKLRSGRLTVDDTTLLGRLNCTAGGFVCNRYGLRGPSYSVSAACATSLVALFSAIQMIRNGVLDAAVVGGGEEYLQPCHYLEFSALKALAGLSGLERTVQENSRPFDAGRDGMVLGEGGGMIVVERESLAKKRGARVQAYITGMGASNNDRGMVEPLAETQIIAMRASFRDAGYGPDRVDLVECHATSTVQGDVEEIKALKALFPQSGRTILTSFKSQIGHTLGASGINNLIRGVTAMQTGIFPPTLNYRNPDPLIDLDEGGFHVPLQPLEWLQPSDRPRRLEVNAFGFGGANYVVQLEECRDASGRVLVSLPSSENVEHRESSQKISSIALPGVSFLVFPAGECTHRVGVVAEDEQQALSLAQDLFAVLKEGPLSEKNFRTQARRGVFAVPADEPANPLAFICTGQGSQYIGMSKELYDAFPEIRMWMDRIAAVADFDLLNLIFHSTEEDLQKTRWQQPALYTMEFAMVQHLMSLGVKPTATAGHSLGELVAMGIAGVFSVEDGFRIVNKRALCMDKASSLRGDPGTMIAVDAPMNVLEEKVASRNNVFFTNFNSPRQVVLGGDTEPVLALLAELKQAGYRATQLKVSMAFHSPIMKVIRDEMAQFVSDIPFHAPSIPVLSNTTMKPYPDDPDQIRDILMAHLESPVHWMQNVKALQDDFGIRVFVEIGPSDTLCNLVSQTLDAPLCIPTCMKEGEARAYRMGVAHLFALGHLKPDGVISLETKTPRAAIPQPVPMMSSRPSSADGVAAIVQREINAFVLESFGRILKPQIVEAVRRELDPQFTLEGLDGILQTLPAPATRGVPLERILPALSPPSAQTWVREKPPALLPARETVKAALPSEPAPSEDGEVKVDYVEQFIRIIMSATGYERDEIEPDMDIRQDLAIRSSRLPVIMDEVEKRFGITVSLEHFVGLRTVRELANCIEELAIRTGKRPEGERAKRPAEDTPRGGEPIDEKLDEPGTKQTPEEPAIKRLILEETPLPRGPFKPLSLKPGQAVAVFGADQSSPLSTDLCRSLEHRFGASPMYLNCLGQGKGGSFDLRTAEGTNKAAHRLGEVQSLAGLVLVLDGGLSAVLSGMEDVSSFLTGFFSCFKRLVNSKGKAFCLLLRRGLSPHSPEGMAAEGVLGMLLAAAHEYPSMVFRSVSLDALTDIEKALDLALDTESRIIHYFFHDQEPFSMKAVNRPLSLVDKPEFELGTEDVVVISGGAKGVTWHIARALAPYRPHVVLLGRTELDTAKAYAALREIQSRTDRSSHDPFESKDPGSKKILPESGALKGQAGLEIARNMSRLSALGLKVSYHRCDVADPRSVDRTLDQVAKQFGRIDGIIHGAGIIRDAFTEFMTPEDFKEVMEAKFLGAWNLYRASRNRGLRFFAALSSLVAVQGNVGQVNYCAANRSLSALLQSWNASHANLRAKVFLLPPIEGAGMAEAPEVKELMKLRGLSPAFVHADEFAQMFWRELFLGLHQQSEVIVARTFPAVKSTLVEPGKSDGDEASGSPGGVQFKPEDMPMIDSVHRLDLQNGELVARRVFSQTSDLWIEDHKPVVSLKNPPVSGIMAVETVLEAAHLLYPHLSVLGVRRLKFENILECPPGIGREARIVCAREEEETGREVRCRVEMSSADISPSGRLLNTWSTCYRGQVILGSEVPSLSALPGFPISEGDLDTQPLRADEIRKIYEERTGLRGRYRVLDEIIGTGPGVVKGVMVYREQEDMSGLGRVQYLYPLYVLEALMHLFAFYPALRQDEGSSIVLPAGMEEMRFTRPARHGERFILEARLCSRDEQGYTWDGRALDETDTTILQIRSVRMNRFHS